MGPLQIYIQVSLRVGGIKIDPLMVNCREGYEWACYSKVLNAIDAVANDK